MIEKLPKSEGDYKGLTKDRNSMVLAFDKKEPKVLKI